MNILKIEAFSGLSGDMFLGSLAELANAWDELRILPDKLGLKNVEIKITDVLKAGISCKHVKVIDHNFVIHKKKDNDHKHLIHTHEHHQHNAHHRHLKEINKIIDDSDIPVKTKQIAKEIFLLLGQAEAKVHNTDINKIHFHEVGAIDSIIDIVGTAYLLDKLNIQKSYSSDICTGFGFVMTEHGRLPVPAPATKELLLGCPTFSGNTEGEMTTPTGAAILKYLNPDFNMPSLIEEKIGHGPGEKDFIHPNVLRLSLCKSKTDLQENIFIIETNIDDMSSELIGTDFQKQLFEYGALDFYYSQVIMKKGRPGLVVTVVANQPDVSRLANFLLENTTSIGLRYFPVSRQILQRTIKKMQTSFGLIDVKEIILPSGKKRITPEYESCIKIANERKLPITFVINKISSELMQEDTNQK